MHDGARRRRLTTVAPARAEPILRAFFADVVGRYHGRPATTAEVDRAMSDDPSADLAPPTGLLLVARDGAEAVGCVGLRLVGNGIGEVTRLFVVGSARCQGLGAELLDEVESRARDQGLRELRLDTRDDLVEARRLFARRGYEETNRLNEAPYAERWFRKRIG